MADRMMLVVIGALSFWVPTVLLEVLSKGRFSIPIANVLPVVCALCVYWLLRRGGHFRKFRFLPLYLLAGIYFLGPLATTIAGSAFGGGFTRFTAGGHDLLWLAVASFFPPLTMVLAGYNGTLFGLLGITVIFIVAAVRKKPSSPTLGDTPLRQHP
jgi:hypothetical protein